MPGQEAVTYRPLFSSQSQADVQGQRHRAGFLQGPLSLACRWLPVHCALSLLPESVSPWGPFFRPGSSSYKLSSQMGVRFTLGLTFNNHPLKAVNKQRHAEALGVRVSTQELGGGSDSIQP
jgi:hypothetical protein